MPLLRPGGGMRSSDVSIGEALSRIAETFGRLVTQHIQLLRSEVESEGRDLARKGRALGLAIAKAAPFVVAGVVVASLALGQMLGLVLEPWLGRFGTPVMTLVLGVAEVLLAGRWLKTHLPATGERPTSPETKTTALPAAPPRPPTKTTSPMTGAQEKAYGAMG